VLERRRDEALATHRHHAALAAPPAERRFALQIAQCGTDRRLVGQLDIARHLPLAEGEEQRDTLRSPEGEVVSGQTLPTSLRVAEPLAGCRMRATEKATKVAPAHLASEGQRAGSGSQPLPGRLARVEVVVLHAAGHRLEVVLRRVVAQLADVQHGHRDSCEVLSVNTSPGSQGEQVCA
jgi:hypothetical protein